MADNRLFVAFNIDCEASQPAVNDLALGERATLGFAEVLEQHELRGSFEVLPSDVEPHAAVYRDLHQRGHEIGLHVHPAADGYEEFLGVYGPDMQRQILTEATDRHAQAMGRPPETIVVGYASINDYTYGVLCKLGYRHGTCSIPTRVLPECASIHGGAPLDVHYAHAYNRSLVGDLDFVEIPVTVDPESRMWGGKHPQDLRVELVDAKNHWYTINKAVERQIAQDVPVKCLRPLTHNIFDFSDPHDFRRQTLLGMIEHVRAIADAHGLQIVAGATGVEIAAAYRTAVPLGSNATHLERDLRGYSRSTS